MIAKPICSKRSHTALLASVDEVEIIPMVTKKVLKLILNIGAVFLPEYICITKKKATLKIKKMYKT